MAQLDSSVSLYFDHHHILNLRDFFSGMCAGFAFTAVSQPMDYIKTHIQMVGERVSFR